MNKNEIEIQRMAVAWACATLTTLGVAFESVTPRDGGGWDIETPDGWVTAGTWADLARVARAEQRRAARARPRGIHGRTASLIVVDDPKQANVLR